MALFGLNWEESKWPWQFCYIVLYFFASKIGVKLPPGIKVPWHWRGPGRSSASNYHFCQKNACFGQKKAFFQRFHFIQKWSVTPNTIFECVKNDFLLYCQKLVFFTEFNLIISHFRPCFLKTFFKKILGVRTNSSYILAAAWYYYLASTFEYFNHIYQKKNGIMLNPGHSVPSWNFRP